eukprot:1002481-Prymnesium_polylepis.1
MSKAYGQNAAGRLLETSHAVKLMDVRRARRVLHARLVHQLLELAGHQLTGVVGVQSADHAREGAGVAVDLGVERRDESPH